tara:strand:+ start:1314 stop:1556 length:243 start_codon:yes stop_codon:yes gene_type:complete
MKIRVTFNDGKTFGHYAFVVFKAGFIITYVCSGLLMFGSYFMNASEHMKEVGPEVLQEMKQFYFPQEVEEIDCMNCDEID